MGPDLTQGTTDHAAAADIAGTNRGGDPFVAAVNAAWVPVCITDPRLPDNPIVFVNDGFCRLTGYDRGELIGRNCRLLQGPATDRDAVARVRAAVAAGEAVTIDLLNYRKNGEAFWNRLALAAVRDASGAIAYHFASQIDVTAKRDRVATLESDNANLTVELADRRAALRESDERLRVATEAAAVAAWEIALPDLQLTGTPTLNTVYGLPPEVTPDYAMVRALAHPDDAARIVAAFDRAAAGGGEYHVTYRIRRDGGYGWVEVRGQVVRDDDGAATRIVGVSQDVTARRTAAAELELSEESLRLATDAAGVGTWDLDLTTDVLTWPPRTKAMFGISPDAPCSMADFYNGVHPDDAPATVAAFAAALDPAVRASYDVEYRTIGKEDGVIRWVAARGKGLFQGDVCVRALGTAIDITQRRRASERQRFLLDLSDAMRSEGDAQGVKRLAMLGLGDFLGVNRVGYAEADADGVTAQLDTAFVRDAAPLGSRVVLDDFGPAMMARIRAGETIVDDDVAADLSRPQEAWQAIGSRAHVSVPFVREGALRGTLFVLANEPRRWDADDVALIEDVAARTWDAVERARAEAETLASEARLRAVIEAAPIGLIFARASDGAITGHNATVERLLRHPVIASPDVEHYADYFAYHPDGRQVAGHEYPLARALAGEERPELETLYRRGDGSLAYLRFIAAPVRAADGTITGGVVASLDVDREVRAEQRQRLFLTLADRLRPLSNPQAIAVATAAVLGRHLGVSRVGFSTFDLAARTVTHASEYTTGVDPLVGTFPIDRFGAENIADLACGDTLVFDDVLVDPRTALHDWQPVATRASVTVPFIRDGTLRAALYVNDREPRAWRTDDVTLIEEVAARTWDALERARAEAALRDLNATLERRIADSIAERDAIWRESRDMLLVISPGGIIEAVNPAWTATLGYARDDLVGHRYTEFVVDDDVPASDAALASVPSGPLRNFQNRYRHADGSIRDLAWTAAAGDNGKLYCVARDISDQKAAARALETAQEALRQAQKMEAVGQLTGGIAHDFNNMLAVVLGSLDLLGRRLDDNDTRARRYVDAATEGARRAATLTQRLLAFSRRQPLQPEPVDVNRLVGGMSDLLRGSLGGGIQLETVLAGGLWTVCADPNQLENIILNLGINARDAMGGEGKVTIETHNCHLDDRYVAAEVGVTAGQYVLIAVTDAGVGMTPDVIAKAFDPFFTTKDVGKGTGLGLSQVYGFIKQSGGHVRIYSEVGVGTTVKLYLPRLLGEAAASPAPADALEPAGGDAGELILVVEDEAGVRSVTVESLLDLGYRVIEADSGAAALRLLDAHTDVALLFTDVVMPEMNGARLAEAARAARPGLKVLFTTGYTRNAVVHHGVVDPDVELIGKPFTFEALAAKVRKVLDGI